MVEVDSGLRAVATAVLMCHFGLLLLLCLYGWHRLHITSLFRRNRGLRFPPERAPREWPCVTVQLPVYNEKFVVERLIDAAAAIHYPRERLQIQVLDDSSDETTALAAAKVHHYQQLGYPIEHLRRRGRSGYKAGALAEGLARARGELVAIFDADFVPSPDILLRSVPCFGDPRIGMVQARWDHLNRDSSVFTQVQAIMLDAHFMIEHGGRCRSDLYFNFNGTAGVWRAAAIRDAGGWQADTLTEDLDLSYRAQLRGWRFLFQSGLTCPGELPVEMSAFKSQQHRWAKGATQVMLKLLPAVWRSPIPLRRKTEATFHLSGNVAYLLMIIDSVFFLVPGIAIRNQLGWNWTLLLDLPLFCFATLCHLWFFMAGQVAIFHSTKGCKRYVPALLSLGVGLGLNNARAVLEALLGRASEFVRTPKLGDRALGRDHTRAARAGDYAVALAGWEYVEVALGLFYTAAVGWALHQHVWAAVPILLLFQNGFLFAGLSALRERRQRVSACGST